MVDLHCHLLPGIDDGPQSIQESVELAAVAAENGITTIVATSHVSPAYRNDAATMEPLAGAVQQRISDLGLPIEVRTGAEISLSMLAVLDDQELRRLVLGDGPWLLVECPFAPFVPGIEAMLARLRHQGFEIVLAHPERCPAFQRDLATLRRLVADGALVSITAGSLVGRFGRDVERLARQLLDEQLVHNVASDAHNVSRRPPSIARELTHAGVASLAPLLTEAVPDAILRGAPLPR